MIKIVLCFSFPCAYACIVYNTKFRDQSLLQSKETCMKLNVTNHCYWHIGIIVYVMQITETYGCVQLQYSNKKPLKCANTKSQQQLSTICQ